jgi:hypothetical protein
MHLGAFCIENAPTPIVIDLRSVATGLTLVAIGSRQAAIKCLGTIGLYLVATGQIRCI